MKAEFTEFTSHTNWCQGTVAKYTFSAKLFDEPSKLGIKNGRVSKLTITDIDFLTIVAYERGWDIEPKRKHKKYYKAVMELLENSPKRFE